MNAIELLQKKQNITVKEFESYARCEIIHLNADALSSFLSNENNINFLYKSYPGRAMLNK